MCGRFSLSLSYHDLLEFFGLADNGLLEPRFNIAPSQLIPAVRLEKEGRRLVMLQWGLIPSWAKDSKFAFRTINARSETAHTMPSFRGPFRHRRCIIPADGFFEWDKKSGSRQPYFIRRADGKPLAFAGLWDRWQNPKDKTVVESCSILTTDANRELSPIHDRMPVLLEPSNFTLWLDPEEQRPEQIRRLLRPADDGQLVLQSVSSYVNNPRNEGEKCLEPAPDIARGAG